MSIKGIPFIGKVKEFLWNPIYVTVQKIGHSRAALDVIHKGYYMLNPVPSVAFIAEAGSTDEIIKLTNHGFKPGDLIRFDVTSNSIDEFEVTIDSIIDADNFKLAGYLSASITAGDTFFALRPVSERFAADGSTLASISTPPVSYNRKVAGVTTQTYVLEDQDNSANNRNLPVTIKSIDGAPINVYAGDLQVSIDHANDSTKIGDGTNLVGVTANNELKTYDKTVSDLIGTSTDSFSVDPITDPVAPTTMIQLLRRIAMVLPLGRGGQDELDSISTAFCTESKVIIGPIDSLPPAVDTDDSGLNGRLIRIAQRLTSLIALLPSSIGRKTGADSLSVVLSSDHATVPVAGTVAVSNSFATASNQTDGSQTTKVLGLAKGSTVAAEQTVTTVDANHNAADIFLRGVDPSLLSSNNILAFQEMQADGVHPFSSKLIPYNAQSVSLLADYYAKVSAAIVHGWDSVSGKHKEILLTANGEVKASIVNTSIAIEGSNTNAVKTREDLNTAGSLAKNTVTNAGTTIIPPANAVGFFIKNHSNSADNLYWEIGGTANADSNDLLPGQGSAFIPIVANISLYTDTTAKYLVQWAVK